MYPLKFISACSLLSVAGTCGAAASAPAPQQPNIILINIDDFGWADTGYRGSGYYETPNIDRLHSRGISFVNAYAGAANSAPSRACLLTGLNTPRHGVYTVNPAERGRARDRKLVPCANNSAVPENFVLLPQALRDAGYQTCHIGKWHVTSDPTTRGMDVNIGGYEAGHPKTYFSPYRNPNLEDGPVDENLTDRLADEAVRYISSVDRRKPFFLYFATYAVHTPLQGKPELVEKYSRKQPTDAHSNPVYAAMVETMDAAVGRVLAAVEENGISENTLIVFTSDNGGVYHISRQWPLRAGKGSFYEGGIREPFIIYQKGRYEGGVEYDHPVSQLDLYPTFAALAGARPDIDFDGVSLLPFLDEGKSRYLDRRTLYWHFPAYLEAYKGLNEARDPLFRARPLSVIRRGEWKLIHNYEDGVDELYNLADDPSEKHDVAAAHPSVVRRLHADLKKWLEKTHAPIPTELNPKYEPEK